MLAKTTFIDGTTVEPAWLNSIPALNCEPLPNYIGGLDMFYSGTDSPIIGVRPGIATSWGGAEYVTLSSTCYKNIESTWAAGSGSGGRPPAVSLQINTWYHVFVIRNTNTGANDCGFDTSLYAANLLQYSGYNLHRRVGSVYYLSSVNKITPFLQYGDKVLYKHLLVDDLVSLPADGIHRFRPAYSPPCKVDLICKTKLTGGAAHVWPCGINDVGGLGGDFAGTEDFASVAPFGYAVVSTDYEGRINARRNASVTSCKLLVLGYYDRRVLE
jgi:hypothetical protein